MKFAWFYPFCVMLAVTFAKADYMNEVRALSKLCQEDYPVPKEEMMNAFKKDVDAASASDNLKCHIKCIMEKGGSYSKGSFDFEQYSKGLQNILALKDRQTEAHEALGVCKLESGADDCETAFKITKCMANKLMI